MNEPIINTLLDIPKFCHWGESTIAMIKRMNERLAAHMADGTCCLTKHMNHPVRTFSFCNKRIQRPGCSPHDITSCFIIPVILIRNTA